MPTTERILSTALTICAVVFAGVLIKREFFDPKAGVQGSAEAAPSLINNWRELRNEGIPLRSPDAPVVVVEFSDLECPACKQFHSELKDAANDLHSNIGLVMLHYPLSIHRFANAAARALECASSAGVP